MSQEIRMLGRLDSLKHLISYIILVVIFTSIQTGCGGSDVLDGSTTHTPGRTDPYFDQLSPGNVTVLVDQSAYLKCRVHNLGDHKVVWVRLRDYYLLTVDAVTYSSDDRFMVLHQWDSDEWTLAIRFAQKRDAGMYGCQISTQPMRSIYVNLIVKNEEEQPTVVQDETSDFSNNSALHQTCSIFALILQMLAVHLTL